MGTSYVWHAIHHWPNLALKSIDVIRDSKVVVGNTADAVIELASKNAFRIPSTRLIS
jgi:hypothetical protein